MIRASSKRRAIKLSPAMRAGGKPVEYLVYTDEGHGFARPCQSPAFFSTHAEAFLAQAYRRPL